MVLTQPQIAFIFTKSTMMLSLDTVCPRNVIDPNQNPYFENLV